MVLGHSHCDANCFLHCHCHSHRLYANLPRNATVRLPDPQKGDSQGQETFLASSADKQTCNYETHIFEILLLIDRLVFLLTCAIDRLSLDFPKNIFQINIKSCMENLVKSNVFQMYHQIVFMEALCPNGQEKL